MLPIPGHDTLKVLLLENQKILMENNQYLRKLHRSLVWGLWLRIVGWVFLLGLPVIAYYYLLEPYISVISGSMPTLQGGVEELREFRTWYETWQRGGIQ